MMNELVALSLFVFLLSTVESQKQKQKPIKKVLSIVKEIKKNMLTLNEMEVMKGQIVDEVVDSIVPVIKESCSCCDDEPQQDCEAQGNASAQCNLASVPKKTCMFLLIKSYINGI